jgi:hypothetical protein
MPREGGTGMLGLVAVRRLRRGKIRQKSSIAYRRRVHLADMLECERGVGTSSYLTDTRL